MISGNATSESSIEMENSNFEIPWWTRNIDLSCVDLDVFDKFNVCSKFEEMK